MIRELLQSDRGLLVQGITGRQGRLETKWMLDSGTRITAGVTPGRGGQHVHGIPVYDTVAAAVQVHGNMICMSYVPGARVVEAAIESISAGIRLVVMSAESVPVHHLVRLREFARKHDAVVIGPNSQGIVVPGIGRIGCPGGTDPAERFCPGDVAVVSRSGGMGSEIAMLIRTWGGGTSVQIHIGGSPIVATELHEAVRIAQMDVATRRTVVFGEPSGFQEDGLATAIKAGRVKLPLIVLVAGRFIDALPAILPFGHAPRAGVNGAATVVRKVDNLRRIGASIAESLSDLQRLLSEPTSLRLAN